MTLIPDYPEGVRAGRVIASVNSELTEEQVLYDIMDVETGTVPEILKGVRPSYRDPDAGGNVVNGLIHAAQPGSPCFFWFVIDDETGERSVRLSHVEEYRIFETCDETSPSILSQIVTRILGTPGSPPSQTP